MQAILVDLERGRLIVRSRHTEHGRVIVTERSKAGHRAVAAGAKAADKVERQMLSTLSAEEARLLRGLLERCAAALADQPTHPEGIACGTAVSQRIRKRRRLPTLVSTAGERIPKSIDRPVLG